MRKFLIIFILISLVVLIGAFLAYTFFLSSLNKELPISEDTTFTITPGSTVNQIVSDLESKDIIGSKQSLLLYLKLNPEVARNFKAGDFIIKKGTTAKTLTDILQRTSSDNTDILVTIPEGLRYDEIATILETAFIKNTDTKFIKSEYIATVESPDGYEFSQEVENFLSANKPSEKNLEGFLYPDTYYFSKDSTALEVIEKQITTLAQKLSDDNMKDIQNSNYSFYEYLIISSMIEREAFTQDEKADIADVIFKRLENGVSGVKLLQIDATLLYQAKDWKADPFIIKNTDGPYNTYTRVGLTPTPISNPGIDSILSSLYPKSNDYYFYIHDSDGVIHFARNQSEHNANVRKYLNQ